MKKRIVGRTARGLRVRQQVRDKIIFAYIALIQSGSSTPTALATARRARLSLRVIFKHFANLSELRFAAIAWIEERGQTFYAEPIRYDVPVEQRLQRFIDKHTQMLETVAPFRRAAAMVEYSDPLVSAAVGRARDGTVKQIERTLGPSIKHLPAQERRKLITGLHVVCAWPSWETMRGHHRLSVPRARWIMAQAAESILRDALGRGASRKVLKKSRGGDQHAVRIGDLTDEDQHG